MIFSQIIFLIGILGIILNRSNYIILLMCLEIILLGINLLLINISLDINDLQGQILSLIILTVAAAEASIGLAILVVISRNQGTISLNQKYNNFKSNNIC